MLEPVLLPLISGLHTLIESRYIGAGSAVPHWRNASAEVSVNHAVTTVQFDQHFDHGIKQCFVNP